MVSFGPLTGAIPLPNGHSWLTRGGDPNHLLNGMILQVDIQIPCVDRCFNPQTSPENA